MKKQVLETFNKLAGIYETMGAKDNLYNTQYERPAMMGHIPADLTGLRVLDAGCSAGWYSKQLAGRGAQVTAWIWSSPCRLMTSVLMLSSVR